MSPPLRVAVLGSSGRMGQVVRAEIAADPGLVLAGEVHEGTGVTPGCFDGADVVVDFSLPDALEAALDELGGRPLVTGTTGLSDAQRAKLEAAASHGPVLTAANFSTGVTLLLDLVERAARALPDYDIEVVESHHRHKMDAPSGTAKALMAAAARGRGVDPATIPAHALRMGDVVGDHQVWLAGEGDRVLLGHVATSRRTFAHGALRAARWIVGKQPGRYAMRDVLGL